jgi:hypothetical protein
MADQSHPAQSERRATLDIWQEPHGYWSASVVVRVPGMADWDQSALGFHNFLDAMHWCNTQVEMAVSSAC